MLYCNAQRLLVPDSAGHRHHRRPPRHPHERQVRRRRRGRPRPRIRPSLLPRLRKRRRRPAAPGDLVQHQGRTRTIHAPVHPSRRSRRLLPQEARQEKSDADKRKQSLRGAVKGYLVRLPTPPSQKTRAAQAPPRHPHPPHHRHRCGPPSARASAAPRWPATPSARDRCPPSESQPPPWPIRTPKGHA